jgi:copper(I)-binding protein
MKPNFSPRAALAASATVLSLLMAGAANAQAEPSLKVAEPWVRATVPGSSVAAAYMQLSSAKPLKFVKAESAAAKTVELHNMTMKDGVMEMKAVEAINVPANGKVELKPGGYHIMLINIAKPVKVGDTVPLKLTFETADKKTFTVDVSAKGKDAGGGMAHQH